MNKILTYICVTIVAVIIVVVLGRLFLLSGLEVEIDAAMAKLAASELKVTELREKVDAITTSKANSTGTKEKPMILSLGQESELMKLFYGNSVKVLKVNTYDLLSPYLYKPEISESGMEVPQETPSDAVQQMPTLDENGMPIDAYASESDDNEWEGLEVTPLKITFSTTSSFMATFFKYMTKFPVHTIRSADLIFNENGIIKGTLVLAFPLTEKIK